MGDDSLSEAQMGEGLDKVSCRLMPKVVIAYKLCYIRIHKEAMKYIKSKVVLLFAANRFIMYGRNG